MNITSEQKFDTINVTDLDIAFPNDLQTYTLREGVDTLTNDGVQMVITLGTEGKVVFNIQHAHWYAQRERTMRVPVSPAATPKE